MFVNGLPFLVTSSRGLSLVTIEHLPLRTAKRLAQTLERVLRQIFCSDGDDGHGVLETQAFDAPCGITYYYYGCIRERWKDRTKDQNDQGEGKGYVQYSALQEATKDNGNRVTTLLCNVGELVSREIGHLRKMEPMGVGIPNQAGR